MKPAKLLRSVRLRFSRKERLIASRTKTKTMKADNEKINTQRANGPIKQQQTNEQVGRALHKTKFFNCLRKTTSRVARYQTRNVISATFQDRCCRVLHSAKTTYSNTPF